jgi:hypothetical protein
MSDSGTGGPGALRGGARRTGEAPELLAPVVTEVSYTSAAVGLAFAPGIPSGPTVRQIIGIPWSPGPTLRPSILKTS